MASRLQLLPLKSMTSCYTNIHIVCAHTHKQPLGPLNIGHMDVCRVDHLGLIGQPMWELVPGGSCFYRSQKPSAPAALHLRTGACVVCPCTYIQLLSACWTCSCNHTIERSCVHFHCHVLGTLCRSKHPGPLALKISPPSLSRCS